MIVRSDGGPGGPGAPPDDSHARAGDTPRWRAAAATFTFRGAAAGREAFGTEGARRLQKQRPKTGEVKREAKRRTVEFRMYYADYQAVDGVMLPHRFQKSVDGKPAEEVVFESVKVNPKIDAKKFTVCKQ